MRVRTHDRWGNLLCLDSAPEMERKWNEIIRDWQMTGEFTGHTILCLRCECGHEFSLRMADFPGKRRMRNCGRDECPFAQQEKQDRADRQDRLHRTGIHRRLGRPPRTEGRKAQLNLYLPVATVEKLDRFSRARGWGVSQAAALLIESGVDLWNKDEEEEKEV